MKHLPHYLFLLATVLLSGCTTDVQLTSTSWLTSAAIVGVISALVQSIISWLVKDKEYKNEYFKKVIEKRLKAIESIEDATAPLRLYYLTKNPDGSESLYHVFLTFSESKEAFKDAVAATSKHVIWHSKPTTKTFGAFTRKISFLLRQFENLDEVEREKLAKTEYIAINEIMANLHQSIAQDMLILYKVKPFLEEKIRRI